MPIKTQTLYDNNTELPEIEKYTERETEGILKTSRENLNKKSKRNRYRGEIGYEDL